MKPRRESCTRPWSGSRILQAQFDAAMNLMSAPLRPLDPARVDIWYARVPLEPSAPQIDRCRTVLDGEEIARADRFLFPRDRALFAVAHALVRTSLSRYAKR